MKKKVVLLTAALVIFALMAGCGKTADNTVSGENSGTSGQPDSNTAANGDTYAWLNAAASIPIKMNDGDFSGFTGYPSGNTTKEMAEDRLSDEGLGTKELLDERIDWLKAEGYRSDLKREREKITSVKPDMTQEESDKYIEENSPAPIYYKAIVNAYRNHAENSIVAYDYGLIIEYASYAYHAGIYTEQEAYDICIDAAKEIQSVYDSWEDFIADYVYGVQFFYDEDTVEDPDSLGYEKMQAYEKVKNDDSVYQVDFKLPLA